MSEDITKGVGDSRSFEERVFARLQGLETRVMGLEEGARARPTPATPRSNGSAAKGDSALRQLQPIWESVRFEISRLNATIDRFERTKARETEQILS